MPRPFSSADNVRWRALPDFELHWKFLEGRYVVFNSGSGHTHILDPIASLVIQQLPSEANDTAGLAEQVGGLLDLEVTEELREKLEQVLGQLSDLDLIEPVGS